MQKNLQIGISCHTFCLDGGMGRYVLLLTRSLSSLGYRPVVISKKLDTNLPEYRLIDPIKINTALIPQKLVDTFFNYRLGQVRREQHLDLVLSCNRNTHSNVAMCGGTHIGYLRAMGKDPTFFDKQQIRLESAYYDHCDLVVAHSKQMKRELMDFYSISEKVYSQAQGAANAAGANNGEANTENNANGNDGNVYDADYKVEDDNK